MATLTAGNTFSATISDDQTVTISVNHNNAGRISFTPSNPSAVAGVGGAGASFGPLPMSKIFGPFGVAGTVTIYADVGTVTYTVNASSLQDVTVANSYAQTAGTFSATGTGAKTLTASSTGSVTLGATGTGTTTITRVNALSVVSTDSSGTPGNATINNLSGRAAFAAAASTVVITNSLVTAASKVFVSLGGSDATLTGPVRVTPAAGSFTVTGNAAATGTTVFDFLVVN